MFAVRRLSSPTTDERPRLATTRESDHLKSWRRRKDRRSELDILACIGATVLALGLSATAATKTDLADPFEVVAAVDRASDMELWPGFDAAAYPIAIYDGESTLLLRHPNPPDEFEPLEGHDGVWVSAGKHPAMRWNSNADIG
ncbi:MAG: hypothetical protein OQK55_10165, partial [Thermoanaerobaculales bacterium]|nr:hypothetical protein [Thermoanaerobaculales bacterium]